MHCIAAHPSDMCVALYALDAKVRVRGPAGERRISRLRAAPLPGRASRPRVLPPARRADHLGRASPWAPRRALAVREGPRPPVLRLRARLLRRRRPGAGRQRSAPRASRWAAWAPRPWRVAEAEQSLVGKPAARETYAQAARDRAPRREAAAGQRVQGGAGEAHRGARVDAFRGSAVDERRDWKAVPRADGLAKVTGAARYSYEWPVADVAYGSPGHQHRCQGPHRGHRRRRGGAGARRDRGAHAAQCDEASRRRGAGGSAAIAWCRRSRTIASSTATSRLRWQSPIPSSARCMPPLWSG